MIIDIHTHAFPDEIAEHAMPLLEEEADIAARLDGKISSLLESMDRAGVDVSVVSSISTKPSQFEPILEWSREIASERIMPFPSVYPADPEAADQVSEIARSGFRGLKLHPYYQNFVLDDPDLNGLYERAQREGLVVLVHTGFDIAYPRERIADPKRVVALLSRFPELKLIASHFGASEDWDEVEKYLLGKKVYFDSSFSIPYMGLERAKRMLHEHNHDFFLFGTDSPWGDQSEDLAVLRNLVTDQAYLDRLLGGNAATLLGLI